jgi:hypothetical protein
LTGGQTVHPAHSWVVGKKQWGGGPKVEDGEHKKCGVHKVRREEKNRRKGTGEIVSDLSRVSGWEETKKQSLNPGSLTRQPKKRGGKRGARKLPAHFCSFLQENTMSMPSFVMGE